MSSLIAGRGESVRESIQSRNAIAISEKIVEAEQKLLDVSGVRTDRERKIISP